MPTSRKPDAAELLLEILELTSFGTTTQRQLTNRLRRTHPVRRVANRVEHGLRTLIAEGLVESDFKDGVEHFHATRAGLAALEQRGRMPSSSAVMFTDIVGSTEMIAELGEAAAHDCRKRHFALLRGSIDQHGGREVKNLGDGLMVLFADPAAALDCARQMQEAVDADADNLGLRIGVHAGELLREHGDYFGTTVIVASRLCDRADAGETIVSAHVRELADQQADSARPERPQPLGKLHLKGIPRPVEAFQLG